MKVCRRRFNLYFLPLMVWLLAPGCALLKKERGPTAIIRVHVETESMAAGSNKTISIFRSHPLSLNISTDTILTEKDVSSAQLFETSGDGFALQIKFEDVAGWRLEQYSAVNPGKHLAIFAQWDDQPEDGRWLAAPIIARRIGEAKVVFTPDASRDEMQTLVDHLNANAKRRSGSESQK